MELFPRVLDGVEIQSIYAAGAAGKCAPQRATPPGQMVSWFPGDGHAYDIQGTNHGTLLSGAVATGTGPVGQAFSFVGSDAVVQVPDDAAWNFGSADFTIDTWVYFNAISGTDVFCRS